MFFLNGELDVRMLFVEILLEFVNMSLIPKQDKSIIHIPDIVYGFEFLRTIAQPSLFVVTKEDVSKYRTKW